MSEEHDMSTSTAKWVKKFFNFYLSGIMQTKLLNILLNIIVLDVSHFHTVCHWTSFLYANRSANQRFENGKALKTKANYNFIKKLWNKH